MLFNSFVFLVFLPLVFLGYWFLFGKSRNLQNLFIVIASYVFYGWWDWSCLILIAFTSLWAFVFGLLDKKDYIQKDGSVRGSRCLLALSCIVNLGILGIFKYYNFFVDQTVVLLQTFGFEAHASSLRIILPVGISFYTFQTLSYTIDVYRRKIEPTKDIIAFFAFISFFPQLVAGPIERATNFLPQFLKPRKFDYASAVDGCRQMLWGFFKKMVVADNCAVVANYLLNNDVTNGVGIWYGIFCFTFQIYGDFSGYSDIAIGCGKLFGVRLMRNFAFPYFSRDIAEFWRRWHISLTTWFRDYLYIPLGGSRGSKWLSVRNTLAIFLVSGFWHGANWTFILWGAFHALLFLPLLLRGKNRTYLESVAEGKWLPSWRESAQMLRTFLLALIGWVFFRAQDMSVAFLWLDKMFSLHEFRALGNLPHEASIAIIAVLVMLVCEWVNRFRDYGFVIYPRQVVLRWLVYLAFVGLIIFYAPGSQSFIYFQF